MAEPIPGIERAFEEFEWYYVSAYDDDDDDYYETQIAAKCTLLVA